MCPSYLATSQLSLGSERNCALVSSNTFILSGTTFEWSMSEQSVFQPSQDFEQSSLSQNSGILTMIPFFCGYDRSQASCSEFFLDPSVALATVRPHEENRDSLNVAAAYSEVESATLAVWEWVDNTDPSSETKLRFSFGNDNNSTWTAPAALPFDGGNSAPSVVFDNSSLSWLIVFSSTSTIRKYIFFFRNDWSRKVSFLKHKKTVLDLTRTLCSHARSVFF